MRGWNSADIAQATPMLSSHGSNGVCPMRRKCLILSFAPLAMASLSATAQDVIVQEQPGGFIGRVFAPVTETFQTITAGPASPVYVSTPTQATVVTQPSRVTTTTTTRVIQTQTRISDPVFDSLARQLRDILPDRRREAAFALGQLRNPRAVPLLLDRLRVDLNKNVRKACVVALSQIPDPAIPGYLERVAIYDPNAEVRLLATNLMRKLSEAVIVETPVEVINQAVTAPRSTIIEAPATEAVITNPTTTVIQGSTVIQGAAPAPATAQAQPQLRSRQTTPGVIVSEPIDKPAVNPLQPGAAPPAEPELKLNPPASGTTAKPQSPNTGPAKPTGASGVTPPLSPPATEPPPLEALPDEIPQNTRKEPANQPAKPRSA